MFFSSSEVIFEFAMEYSWSIRTAFDEDKLLAHFVYA